MWSCIVVKAIVSFSIPMWLQIDKTGMRFGQVVLHEDVNVYGIALNFRET